MRLSMDEGQGRLEVIVGGMFSGKSSLLFHRLRRAHRKGSSILLIKPVVDTRNAHDKIETHDGLSYPAIGVSETNEILNIVTYHQVVGIDEAQFFDDDLTEVALELLKKDKRVLCAGLDLDAEGKPFGPMPTLLSHADEVIKLHAVCVQCGRDARRTVRVGKLDDPNPIGGADKYEARCRRCV